MSRRSVSQTVLLLGCIALMSGCTSKIVAETREAMFPDPINLKERNYATADYLVSQIQTFVSRRDDVIKAVPLVDIDQPTLSAPVGKVISEQIGERFSKLGYQVDLSDVTNAQDALYMDSMKNRKPDFVLSGHYQTEGGMFSGSTLDVHLRVLDTASGRVISTYDYTVPYTSDMKDLGKTEPLIYKVPN